MNMTMSPQIAQTKSHHQAHQQGTEITIPMQGDARDPHPIITIKIGTITMITGTDISLAGQDPIPTVIATGVTVKATHEGVILGPITDPHTAAHHTKETQACTATDETLHTGDPHHTEVSPEITVDPDHIHHTNTPTKHHQNHPTAPTAQPGRKQTGNINESPLMIHHPNITALMNKPENQMRI